MFSSSGVSNVQKKPETVLHRKLKQHFTLAPTSPVKEMIP